MKGKFITLTRRHSWIERYSSHFVYFYVTFHHGISCLGKLFPSRQKNTAEADQHVVTDFNHKRKISQNLSIRHRVNWNNHWQQPFMLRSYNDSCTNYYCDMRNYCWGRNISGWVFNYISTLIFKYLSSEQIKKDCVLSKNIFNNAEIVSKIVCLVKTLCIKGHLNSSVFHGMSGVDKRGNSYHL